MTSLYRWDKDILYLSVHIQPNASKSEWAGLHGERIKIRIQSPPVDGKANRALIEFIAQAFGVAKSQVSVVSGESSRQKMVTINSPGKIPAEIDVVR